MDDTTRRWHASQGGHWPFPAEMPWIAMNVEVGMESTGTVSSPEGVSKHLDAGANNVVSTAPGKNCPAYVVGVNEEGYDAATDTVVSHVVCPSNGMASLCKVFHDCFKVELRVAAFLPTSIFDLLHACFQSMLEQAARSWTQWLPLQASKVHVQIIKCSRVGSDLALLEA